MSDLDSVIEDSISDSELPAETPEDTSSDDASSETSEVASPATDTAETPEETPEPGEGETPEPGTTTPAPQDEFAKRFGIPELGASGRENRIPYSRVKKIAEKAVSEVAEAALGRKLAPGEKAIEVVKQHVAAIPTLTSKVTEYEARLEKVGQFEDVLANQPRKFLELLETIPAYKGFFDTVRDALSKQDKPATDPGTETVVTDDMPQPNQELSDGTFVYDMDGLKGLLAWQAKQVEDRVTKQVETRYSGMETAWREDQHIKSVVPVIRAQIAEAQTWPMFTENEAEITQVLESDKKISLEGAYRKVVFPKLALDRDKMRQSILAEVKAAPQSTAVGSTTKSSVRPTTSGPRSLEEIISESIQSMK